ncbi:LptA/OstA family protein [Sphingomonas sp. LB-2]|uniref:LptA/OstA family protein n=1 Tax=Sphingomonas caeni TaxID=2984949 RepID=UPI0022320452|nr:LptA/OstA family protein [Sphingomonas caeni]MCW3847067.1 LptA/OstA family protein [Sphingomonas caeni]
MLRALALLPLGLTLAISASVPASAQQSHDSSAPIDFGAEHIEIQERANRVLLTGAVKITQAEMTLNSARMTLTYTGEITNPQVNRIDASGGVTIVRPDQSASSQYAVYDLNTRIVTLLGGVTLRQGPNVIQGSRLTINLDTGRATIDGSGVSGGAPGTTTQGGRVTGRFSVPQRATTPAPAATPKQ